MPRNAGPLRPTRLASGKTVYKVAVDVGPDPANGARRQRRGSFPTQRAARAWLAQTRVDVEKKTYVAPVKLTLGEYLDQWLAGRVDVKPTTRRNYEDALKPVRRTLAARPLQALTKADLDSMVAGMLDGSLRSQGKPGQPLSPRAVRLTLTVLGMALKAAMEEGRVQRNVAQLVKRPKAATARKTGWEPAEVEAFLAAADLDPLGGAFRLSLHGLRRGEVCGLRWEDVELETGDVAVRRSRVLVAGIGVVAQEDAKTAASARVVWMGPGTAAAVGRLRTAQAEARLAAAPGVWQDSGLVVQDALGRGVRPDWYADAFGRCASAAGVPLVSLHQARHAFGSYLIHKGVPIPVVSRLLGHADPAVTMAIYAHALETGSREQVMAALTAVGL
ncbi:MAG: tyrosine-type recombinase/integrase [Deinococcus sp.]